MTVTDSANLDRADPWSPDGEVRPHATTTPAAVGDANRTTSPGRDVAWGIAAASALVAATALLVPLGTSNDDVILNSIYTGQFIGEAGPQGLFSNVIVGWLTMTLAAAAPTVPWFGLILLATHILATGSFLGIVALRAGRRSGSMLMAVASVLALDLWAVSELSWTSAAFASAAAGIAVAITPRSTGLGASTIVIWAAALFGWGAALRFESAIGVVLVVAPVVLMALFDRSQRRLIVTALSTCLLLAGVGLVVQRASLDADWRAFADYTSVRGPLADSSRLDSINFDDPAVQAIDITEADVLLFDTWFFDDPAVFGLAQLEELSGLTGVSLPSADTAEEPVEGATAAESGPNNLVEHGLKLVVISVLSLIVIASGATRAQKVGALGSLALAVAAIPAIMIVARMTGRVLVGLLVTAAYVAIASTAGKSAGRSPWTTAGNGVGALAALASVIVLVAVTGPANGRQHDSEVARLEALAAHDANGTFLLWEEPLGDLGLFGLRDLPDLDLVLNGWIIASPTQERQLDRLGIDDQFTAVVERSDVHVVTADGDRLDALADFLERRRGRIVRTAVASNGIVAEISPEQGSP